MLRAPPGPRKMTLKNFVSAFQLFHKENEHHPSPRRFLKHETKERARLIFRQRYASKSSEKDNSLFTFISFHSDLTIHLEKVPILDAHLGDQYHPHGSTSLLFDSVAETILRFDKENL
jgi:hypothetical protein